MYAAFLAEWVHNKGCLAKASRIPSHGSEMKPGDVPLRIPSYATACVFQAAEQLYMIRSTVDALLGTVLPQGNFPSRPGSADDR